MSMSTLNSNQIHTLLSEEQIQNRIKEMGQTITNDYNDNDEIVAMTVLKGGVVFFSDMIRNINRNLFCEFLGTSSYGDSKQSSGEVKLTLDTKFPLTGKHILLFEDIVDTGLTLSYLIKLLEARNPASIKLCSLLFKPESLKTDLKIDYVGFEIGKEFVIGYGMDYAGLYRNLPYVGVVKD